MSTLAELEALEAEDVRELDDDAESQLLDEADGAIVVHYDDGTVLARPTLGGKAVPYVAGSQTFVGAPRTLEDLLAELIDEVGAVDETDLMPFDEELRSELVEAGDWEDEDWEWHQILTSSSFFRICRLERQDDGADGVSISCDLCFVGESGRRALFAQSGDGPWLIRLTRADMAVLASLLLGPGVPAFTVERFVWLAQVSDLASANTDGAAETEGSDDEVSDSLGEAAEDEIFSEDASIFLSAIEAAAVRTLFSGEIGALAHVEPEGLASLETRGLIGFDTTRLEFDPRLCPLDPTRSYRLEVAFEGLDFPSAEIAVRPGISHVCVVDPQGSATCAPLPTVKLLDALNDLLNERIAGVPCHVLATDDEGGDARLLTCRFQADGIIEILQDEGTWARADNVTLVTELVQLLPAPESAERLLATAPTAS